MTASKTQAIDSKLMKVAQDAEKFATDPVYGPLVQKEQDILLGEL
jgi:hypothetical protein